MIAAAHYTNCHCPKTPLLISTALRNGAQHAKSIRRAAGTNELCFSYDVDKLIRDTDCLQKC